MNKYAIVIANRAGLKPDFKTMVNVSAYNEEHAKQKALGQVLQKNPIFKRRKSLNFWNFEIINLNKGEGNGSEENNEKSS